MEPQGSFGRKGLTCMVNCLELERVMTFVEDNPDNHTQEEWICGSGACFAGWACMLNGWSHLALTDYVTKDGDCRHTREVAQEILGIRATDALILFWGNNTPQKLRLMVKDLCNGEALRDYWMTSRGRRGVLSMVRMDEVS